jgi:hypothetical protein
LIEKGVGHYFYDPAEAPTDRVVYEWQCLKLLNRRKGRKGRRW